VTAINPTLSPVVVTPPPAPAQTVTESPVAPPVPVSMPAPTLLPTPVHSPSPAAAATPTTATVEGPTTSPFLSSDGNESSPTEVLVPGEEEGGTPPSAVSGATLFATFVLSLACVA